MQKYFFILFLPIFQKINSLSCTIKYSQQNFKHQIIDNWERELALKITVFYSILLDKKSDEIILKILLQDYIVAHYLYNELRQYDLKIYRDILFQLLKKYFFEHNIKALQNDTNILNKIETILKTSKNPSNKKITIFQNSKDSYPLNKLFNGMNAKNLTKISTQLLSTQIIIKENNKVNNEYHSILNKNTATRFELLRNAISPNSFKKQKEIKEKRELQTNALQNNGVDAFCKNYAITKETSKEKLFQLRQMPKEEKALKNIKNHVNTFYTPSEDTKIIIEMNKQMENKIVPEYNDVITTNNIMKTETKQITLKELKIAIDAFKTINSRMQG